MTPPLSHHLGIQSCLSHHAFWFEFGYEVRDEVLEKERKGKQSWICTFEVESSDVMCYVFSLPFLSLDLPLGGTNGMDGWIRDEERRRRGREEKIC